MDDGPDALPANGETSTTLSVRFLLGRHVREIAARRRPCAPPPSRRTPVWTATPRGPAALARLAETTFAPVVFSVEKLDAAAASAAFAARAAPSPGNASAPAGQRCVEATAPLVSGEAKARAATPRAAADPPLRKQITCYPLCSKDDRRVWRRSRRVPPANRGANEAPTRPGVRETPLASTGDSSPYEPRKRGTARTRR